MQILRNEPLQRRNTLALKSEANAYLSVASEQELLSALVWAREHAKSVVVLGQGSNVVFVGDLNALVIQQGSQGKTIIRETETRVTVKVAAGESWHGFVQWTLSEGYYGLENLALIPGTVGAAPIQNIGAYGVELAPFVEVVNAINIVDGSPVALTRDDCEFGYRDSVFKRALRDKLAITSVELVLKKTPDIQLAYPALKKYVDEKNLREISANDVFDAVVNIRQSRLPDPALIPNAGSFFKNPILAQCQAEALLDKFTTLPCYPQSDSAIKIPAAWLIDQCGWKGLRVGQVGVHPEHALVLVNYGSNDGAAILALANDIAQSVSRTFGIQLEIEPRVYGQ